ncbi:NADH-quinone oxidoreductase subunit NuoF family protein [Allosalinactinospora lopnorensis]|uniref:NADH-quinone oxidoreductase subunit NuoF family protein n=1 Tax=Allosalinactinospora lopnorensis TaxID=1352348 RepID=UPI000623C04B|nr:NADH-quinone oxidoreductase subunit NuoF family protein [Allosalinactinospora lopnorensis]
MSIRDGVPPVLAMGPQRLTAGLSVSERLDWVAHRALHGDIPDLAVDDLVTLAGMGNLRGRGGAGFPFARKINAVMSAAERRKSPVRVVVNATEGEPASAKDAMLLTRAPHLVLDGAELAARALGASDITIGIENGGQREESLRKAIKERDGRIRMRVFRMPERFISGEGGALIQGINGREPIPPGQKTRASEKGVAGVPTLLSNAETYAQLALLALLGADRYSSVGLPTEPGTILMTVTGTARTHTVIEAPSGVPLREVLDLCGATVGRGVLVGGYHGRWLGPEAASEATMSRAGMEEVGGALGAGIVIPIGDGCPLEESTRVLRYLAAESAQQCGPCIRGLPELANAFADLTAGEGDREAVVQAAAIGTGRGACAHPDGAGRMALSAIETFSDDISVHALAGTCRATANDVLPTPDESRNKQEARLMVDWSRCDGHGLCLHLAPSLIQLDPNGYPDNTSFPVPDQFLETAERAVHMCPALALRLDRG